MADTQSSLLDPESRWDKGGDSLLSCFLASVLSIIGRTGEWMASQPGNILRLLGMARGTSCGGRSRRDHPDEFAATRSNTWIECSIAPPLRVFSSYLGSPRDSVPVQV